MLQAANACFDAAESKSGSKSAEYEALSFVLPCVEEVKGLAIHETVHVRLSQHLVEAGMRSDRYRCAALENDGNLVPAPNLVLVAAVLAVGSPAHIPMGRRRETPTVARAVVAAVCLRAVEARSLIIPGSSRRSTGRVACYRASRCCSPCATRSIEIVAVLAHRPFSAQLHEARGRSLEVAWHVEDGSRSRTSSFAAGDTSATSVRCEASVTPSVFPYAFPRGSGQLDGPKSPFEMSIFSPREPVKLVYDEEASTAKEARIVGEAHFARSVATGSIGHRQLVAGRETLRGRERTTQVDCNLPLSYAPIPGPVRGPRGRCYLSPRLLLRRRGR